MDLVQWRTPNGQQFCPAQGLCWCRRCISWLWLRLQLHSWWCDNILGTGFQQRSETQSLSGLGSYHFQDWVREIQSISSPEIQKETKVLGHQDTVCELKGKEMFLGKANAELTLSFCISNSFPRGYMWDRNSSETHTQLPLRAPLLDACLYFFMVMRLLKQKILWLFLTCLYKLKLELEL